MNLLKFAQIRSFRRIIVRIYKTIVFVAVLKIMVACYHVAREQKHVGCFRVKLYTFAAYVARRFRAGSDRNPLQYRLWKAVFCVCLIKDSIRRGTF